MPITYRIIEDQQLVIAEGRGEITAEDVMSHLDALGADSRYQAPMKKLVDYRFISSIYISSDKAVEIASQKRRLEMVFQGERCAFVSPDGLTYGTSRVHQALIDGAGLDTAVFRSYQEALAWLDVEIEQ